MRDDNGMRAERRHREGGERWRRGDLEARHSSRERLGQGSYGPNEPGQGFGYSPGHDVFGEYPRLGGYGGSSYGASSQRDRFQDYGRGGEYQASSSGGYGTGGGYASGYGGEYTERHGRGGSGASDFDRGEYDVAMGATAPCRAELGAAPEGDRATRALKASTVAAVRRATAALMSGSRKR